MDEYSENDIFSGDDLEDFEGNNDVETDNGDDNESEQLYAGDDIDTTEEEHDKEEEVGDAVLGVKDYQDGRASKNDGGSDAAADDYDEELTPYGKLASALREEGILEELAEDEDEVRTVDDFREAIMRRIQQGVDDMTARTNYALNLGVDKGEIANHESLLAELQGVTREDLTDESDEGVRIRRNLIMEAARARGLSDEQAAREVTKSEKAGTDIEDAADALGYLTQRTKAEYSQLIEEQKQKLQEAEEREAGYYRAIGDNIMNCDDGIFKGIPDNVRKSIIENDDKFHEFNQKYPVVAEAAQRVLFALTNGYRDFDVLVAPRVKKGMKNGLAKLERTLKSGEPMRGGNYRLANTLEDNTFDDTQFI